MDLNEDLSVFVPLCVITGILSVIFIGIDEPEIQKKRESRKEQRRAEIRQESDSRFEHDRQILDQIGRWVNPERYYFAVQKLRQLEETILREANYATCESLRIRFRNGLRRLAPAAFSHG